MHPVYPQILLCLLTALTITAAPTISEDEPQFLSYQKLLDLKRVQPLTVARPEFPPPEQKKTIELLAKRASPPVTPQDIIKWADISWIFFSPKGPNRPSELTPKALEARWLESALESFTAESQISAAPFRGFIVMSDGQVYPFELYGEDRLRLFGFVYKK